MSKDLDIRMLIEVDRETGSDYLHVYAKPVKWVYRDYESDRGWRIDRGFDFDEPAYNDLRVSAQGDVRSEEPLYGWRVEYHQPYSVRWEDAQKMAKVLGKVERKLATLTTELDAPENIGQYIARVGLALGIKLFGFYPPRGEQMWASGELIRWDTAAYLDSTIRQRVAALRDQA